MKNLPMQEIAAKFVYSRQAKMKSELFILTGLLIFCGKKSKISRDFQGQIRGKIGRFRGIFAGKKSKFAENRPISQHFRGRKVKIRGKSADFAGFSREKSQDSQKNRLISRDFSGKKSN